MPTLRDYSDDLKTIIGEPHHADYIHQEQEREFAVLLSGGYDEWLDEIERRRDEQAAWKGAKSFNGILIKKACEHSGCLHFRCGCGLRIGGIEV